MRSSKPNYNRLMNVFPTVSKEAIIDKNMHAIDVESRLNQQDDPIRKKVEHDIAPDLDLASGMFVDDDEKNHGVQNIMTLFSDVKAPERHKRWAELFMTPVDFMHYWKQVMSLDSSGTEEGKQEKEVKRESIIVKAIKVFPCVSIRYGNDGGVKFTEMFTIEHKGSFFLYWNFFVTICCLVSSYMYLAMAAFRPVEEGETQFALSILFETIFIIDICVHFMLSFDDDDTADLIVRDITKTS